MRIPKCHHCGKKILDTLPHKCKFCHNYHCHDCLLPEDHNCEGLNLHKQNNQERWKRTVADLARLNFNKEEEFAKESDKSFTRKYYERNHSTKTKIDNILNEEIKFSNIKRKIKTFLTVAIIALIVFLFYYSYWEGSKMPNNSFYTVDKDKVPNSQYYHYSTVPITYQFNASCNGKIKERTELAFSYIIQASNNTLRFVRSPTYYNADLLINCQAGTKAENIDSLADGGFSATEENKIIEYGVLTYYRVTNNTVPESCFNFPVVEIHEILHTLGIGHNNGATDIMQESIDHTTCKYVTKINEKYGKCLESIYKGRANSITCQGVNFILR